MSAVPMIMLALFPAGEPAQTFILPQRIKPFFSSGKKFVDLRLMPDIEHKFVPKAVEDIVESQGQFHDTHVGT